MLPTKRRRLAAFDNGSSCLRRSVWAEMLFERTNLAEDLRRPFVGQHILSELFGLRSAAEPGGTARPYPAPHWTATGCSAGVKERPRRCCGPYRT